MNSRLNQDRATRWLRRMARSVPALAMAGLLFACGAGGGGSDLIEFSRARFVMTPDPRPPADGETWSDQRLPDDWQGSRPGRSGYAWYRLMAPLAGAGDRDYAVYLTATLSNAQLYVNGVLAAQSGDLEGEPPQRWEAQQLFPVPRALLRPGENVLDLRIFVPAGTRGGIGTVLFGPHEPLYQRALRDEIGYSIGPAVASLTILVLGVFMLVLWLRARRDADYLLFAAASILWGLHTAATLLPRAPLPPPHYAVWWNAVYVVFVVLLCILCVRFAHARWPRYERLAMAYAIAAAPILYAATGGAFAEIAAGLRLGAIAIALTALYAVARHALRARSAQGAILLATAVAAAAFGVHDWLAVRDPDNLRPVYLVPYAALLFIGLVGWMMIDRFVRTLRQYEALNIELEQRVAEKSAALEIEVARQAEARADAESANLAKSRFLAAASHDLRQPLHALGLFASALDSRVTDASARELIGRINQSIGALESLFNQVLDVSRLDAGALSADIGAVELQPLFERIGNDLSPDAEEKGLALRFVPTGRVVRSDPVLLERIVRNLVANAIRYTDRGGVVVGARPRAEQVMLEVRDSGVGIAEEHQPRIFEEFYQAGNDARDRRLGLGLGLSIVKRLCDLLGHGISFASAPGRGTVFRISMPAAARHSGEPAAVAPLSGEPLAGRRIVVIEDDRDVRDSMGALLLSWGCEVLAFAGGDEVRQALAPGSPPPSLLIADYRLGGGATGVEVARTLRDGWGGAVPVLIVSGESSATELARIAASGFPMLHKPVPPAKLRSLLLHLLSESPPA